MDTREWQKRLGFIVSLSGLILLSLVVRLYQRAIIAHSQTVQAAEEQHSVRREVIGARGEIVTRSSDSTYYPLAANERRYQVLVTPFHIADAKKTAALLAPLLGEKEQDIYDKINNKKQYLPALKKRLSEEEARKIAELHISGVVLRPEMVRIYPEQTLAAQLLGFVNNDGKGNYGIEGMYDDVLRGSSGYQVGEKDNEGRLIVLGEEVKPKDGDRITLTIDRGIQHYVEQSLAEAVKTFEADSGSVIVVNPKTGAIIAMAAVPTFNPSAFNEIATDQQSIFQNPLVSSVWEPGSIMKPLIMALAIDKNLVQPDTKQTFGASVRVLNHDIFTAEKKAFGEETMTQVLENSDNVGMVWIADKLGTHETYEGLKRFGLGVPPDIKLNSVVTGSLGSEKHWNDLTRATASFGQGISATPLQMVMAYSALANKGVLMKPYVVDTIEDKTGPLLKTSPAEVGHVVSAETSAKVSQMLEAVVQNGHGKRAQVAGFRVGGKTGTAQIPDPKGGYYDDRHIGSFGGYFPLTDPQYAMVVKLDNPKTVKFAESSAGPTFGQIARYILFSKQVMPDVLSSPH